jgi:hypothetical protein
MNWIKALVRTVLDQLVFIHLPAYVKRAPAAG